MGEILLELKSDQDGIERTTTPLIKPKKPNKN